MQAITPTTAFGAAVSGIGAWTVEHTVTTTPVEDMSRVRDLLTALHQDAAAVLRFYRPHPTAAFSPRDTSHAHYALVRERMRALGFMPAERGAGGQLAVYDETALVIDLVSPHPQPREHTRERFRHFSALIAGAFGSLGIDARVGAVEGEYCPGDYSVNAMGRIKLAGLAQRVVKHGYHMGAVLSVGSSARARDAVAEAYGLFGIPFDPASFGAVTDMVPHVPLPVVCQRIADTVAHSLCSAAVNQP
jgi:octanoyl-[GcvH]:protein N-octanoyltransferase